MWRYRDALYSAVIHSTPMLFWRQGNAGIDVGSMVSLRTGLSFIANGRQVTVNIRLRDGEDRFTTNQRFCHNSKHTTVSLLKLTVAHSLPERGDLSVLERGRIRTKVRMVCVRRPGNEQGDLLRAVPVDGGALNGEYSGHPGFILE